VRTRTRVEALIYAMMSPRWREMSARRAPTVRLVLRGKAARQRHKCMVIRDIPGKRGAVVWRRR
jgi:hypothetical protein